jgi:hypothetical protein
VGGGGWPFQHEFSILKHVSDDLPFSTLHLNLLRLVIFICLYFARQFYTGFGQVFELGLPSFYQFVVNEGKLIPKDYCYTVLCYYILFSKLTCDTLIS